MELPPACAARVLILSAIVLIELRANALAEAVSNPSPGAICPDVVHTGRVVTVCS